MAGSPPSLFLTRLLTDRLNAVCSTLTLLEAEEPAPGVETTTLAVPAVAIRLAGTKAVSLVKETKVVLRGVVSPCAGSVIYACMFFRFCYEGASRA